MMKKKPKSSKKRKLSPTSIPTPITAPSDTSETSSRSSQMLQLPQDLITEILLFLPIKSLLRFKCVSKQWLSLISDPKFRIRRRRSPSSVVLCRLSDLIHHVPLSWNSSSYKPPFTSLSFIGSPVNMTILQCSNGLILCRGLRYYICNPSTRQFTTIPIAVSRPPKSSDVSGVYLLFDPAISPRYEIVCIRTHYQSKIEVYSSETCEWRQCGSPFSVPFDIVLNHGVVWNRAIHWISPTGESLCFHIGRETIVTMPSIPSANEKWSKRRFRYFSESGGHLLLAEIFGSGTTHFPVYEMARDYSSWLPKYHVDLSAIVDAFPKMSIQIPHFTVCYAFSLVFVQDDEEGSFLLLEIPGQYISLNLRDGSFKKLSPIPEIGFPIIHQFRESFAAV